MPRLRELAVHDAPVGMARAYADDVERRGAVRHLTATVAHSPAAWQATTRALHLYVNLRRIEPRLVDLLCLRTSLLNGCKYCIDDAAGEALDHGWTTSELERLLLPEPEFDPRTDSALRFATDITRSGRAVSDATFQKLRTHFDEEEILEITTVVSMKNFWNRFATSLRITPEGRCTDEGLIAIFNRALDTRSKSAEGGNDDR